MTAQQERVPPGPDGDDSEGDWLDWRAVIAPPPGPRTSTDPWVLHKIMHSGHNIAEHAWYLRRQERLLFAQLCAAENRSPGAHAPLVIYLPIQFHGVCLTCPWAGPSRETRPEALTDASAHRAAEAGETGEPSWSTIFRHGPGNRAGTAVRTDQVDRLIEALDRLGIARVRLRSVFEDHTDAWPLLDGLAALRDTRGIGPGSGFRLYGDNALLASGVLLDLTPPTGQRTAIADIQRALQVQAGLPHKVQIDWTRPALRGLTDELRAAAELLGPELPSPPQLPAAQTPPPLATTSPRA